MNLRSLLGLGLKFIPTPFRTTTYNEISDENRGSYYLERSLRLRCFFLRVGYPTTDVEFNPKLHVPSIWSPPKSTFPELLEKRFFQFNIQLRKLYKPKKTRANITLQIR